MLLMTRNDSVMEMEREKNNAVMASEPSLSAARYAKKINKKKQGKRKRKHYWSLCAVSMLEDMAAVAVSPPRLLR